MELSLGLAFAAGLLSFLTPCVLALVPVYLAYLGESATSLVPAGEPASAAAPRGVVGLLTQPVVAQAALFTLSFSAVFVLMGISVGLIGAPLFRLPGVREIAGIVVIVLGVLMTGLFGPVLDRYRLGIDLRRLPAARSARSATLGAVFALGWSPCIGPVLGAILTLGASAPDVTAAAALLAFYAAGLAVPFLAAAVALPQLTPLMSALRRRHRLVEVIAGAFIVAMGVLIYLNAFGRLATLFTLPL